LCRTRILQFLPGTNTLPQLLQICLDTSLGRLILAFCAILLADTIVFRARSGRVVASCLDCSQSLSILALASFLTCFFGALLLAKWFDLSP
jgi:hypothetical protein